MNIILLKRLFYIVIAGGFSLSPLYAYEENRKFDTDVIDKIYHIIPYDKESFAIGKTKTSPFIMYKEGVGSKVIYEFDEIHCKNQISLKIFAHANDLGMITIGLCTQTADGFYKRILNARTSMDLAMSALTGGEGMAENYNSRMRDMGWFYRRTVLDNGYEMIYFPVMAVGHGVLMFKTIALIDQKSDRLMIIQYYLDESCNGEDDIKICSDTFNTMSSIAKQFMQR